MYGIVPSYLPQSGQQSSPRQQKEIKMKADKRQLVIVSLKGIAAALLIAGCFFAFNGRLPAADDINGMVALTAVCMAGSFGGIMTDTAENDLQPTENAGNSPI